MLLARGAAPELLAFVPGCALGFAIATERRAEYLAPVATARRLTLAVTARARVAQPVGEIGIGRVEGQRLVVGRVGLDLAVPRHAGPGRDELADDHVLLEPDQPVLSALDGGLGENTGRLLERRRRQPRVGGERRLRDPHELGAALGG